MAEFLSPSLKIFLNKRVPAVILLYTVFSAHIAAVHVPFWIQASVLSVTLFKRSICLLIITQIILVRRNPPLPSLNFKLQKLFAYTNKCFSFCTSQNTFFSFNVLSHLHHLSCSFNTACFPKKLNYLKMWLMLLHLSTFLVQICAFPSPFIVVSFQQLI